MVALFDHEEVGSKSAQGAGSPVLVDALRRITSNSRGSDEVFPITLVVFQVVNSCILRLF